jgi:hypothetical protein
LTLDHTLRRLAFAVRVDDHFSREPIREPLDVKLNTQEPPVTSREGSRRHVDGTYRWADLTDGLRHVSFASPTGQWVRWDPTPLDVVVPIADPTTAMRIEMWPTPLASAPVGVTALRAKLVGAAVANLRVEIDGFGVASSGRWTCADAFGELLYPLPGGPWPRTSKGELDLVVTIPGRTVTSTQRAGSSPVPGARFAVAPQAEARIRINVT